MHYRPMLRSIGVYSLEPPESNRSQNQHICLLSPIRHHYVDCRFAFAGEEPVNSVELDETLRLEIEVTIRYPVVRAMQKRKIVISR